MEKERKKFIQFQVTQEELDMIRAKMESMKIRNMSAYLRKMAIDAYCVHLDLKGLREMTTLTRRCSNNLNQYACKANESGSIYKEDIEDLRHLMDRILEAETEILKDLLHLKL